MNPESIVAIQSSRSSRCRTNRELTDSLPLIVRPISIRDTLGRVAKGPSSPAKSRSLPLEALGFNRLPIRMLHISPHSTKVACISGEPLALHASVRTSLRTSADQGETGLFFDRNLGQRQTRSSVTMPYIEPGVSNVRWSCIRGRET